MTDRKLLGQFERLKAENEDLKAHVLSAMKFARQISISNFALAADNDFLRRGAQINPWWLSQELDRHAKMRGE